MANDMKIAIVTDAWVPQVNGVVRTLQSVSTELVRDGHEVLIISPNDYRSIPCPSYPEIRLAFTRPSAIGARLAAFGPDAIHLSTEGPLGLVARRWCLRREIPFTTAYHTQFPQYIAQRTRLPASVFWPYIEWFHKRSERILVATESVRGDLRERGLRQLAHWGRGVDVAQFSPGAPQPEAFARLERPIQLYVGRVAIEKNIEAFLLTRHAGTRVIVGDGPARAMLEARYRDAVFTGSLFGADLAAAYAGADVFVFPSRTDTFGLVMIEALASGTPVAAYPVSGPVDIVTPDVGALNENLETAIGEALKRNRADCAEYGSQFGWRASAKQFVDALCPLAPAGMIVERLALRASPF